MHDVIQKVVYVEHREPNQIIFILLYLICKYRWGMGIHFLYFFKMNVDYSLIQFILTTV